METKAIYQKAPTYSYQIGNMVVDKEGTLAGDFPSDLLTALAERGFALEGDIPEKPAETETPTPEISTETDMLINNICIEVPLDGFSPEAIDNLVKMVLVKEPLIKMALGAEALPIKVLEDRIAFDWFKTADSEDVMEYAKFITALCDTAKRKKRVISRTQRDFENPHFSMRTWLISLGLVGPEFSKVRRLMTANLPGDGAYRYGKPENGAVSRKREHIHREVISIRLTPDTIEMLNILAAKAETETGQRTSRNMLIEQAAEAYVASTTAGMRRTNKPSQF